MPSTVYDIIDLQKCNSATWVNPHLFPAVLLQTVDQLVRVGEPERQQHKVFVVSLKQEQHGCVELLFISPTKIQFSHFDM